MCLLDSLQQFSVQGVKKEYPSVVNSECDLKSATDLLLTSYVSADLIRKPHFHIAFNRI